MINKKQRGNKKMKKQIVAKINTGKALHVANAGDKGYYVACGSKQHGTKAKIHKIDLDVTKENITCKKCLKAFEETNETATKETDTQAYRIAKLKENIEKEEQAEANELAELKKIWEKQQAKKSNVGA